MVVLVHADLHFSAFRDRAMKTYFNFIEIDMNQFFAICADLGYLSIKIDWIVTAWTVSDNDANYFRSLFHSYFFLSLGQIKPSLW